MDYTKMNQNQMYGAKAQQDYDQGLRSYMLSIYNYMMVALAITGFISMAVLSSPAAMSFFFSGPMSIVVLLLPLLIVFFVMPQIMNMSVQAAQITFWGFAAAMGISIAPIFAAYTGESIAQAFFITSSAFAGLSIYGYTTKRNLDAWRSFLVMGLIGMIVASLVNMFVGSSMISFVVSAAGVLIFAGLTAYDTQRLKDMYYQIGGNQEIASKVAITGALSLYLDFINLFLHILRFVGVRRE